MSKKSAVELFMSARAIGTPLISITCPDPEVTIQKLKAAMEEGNSKVPIIQYDCVRGCRSRNTEGGKALDKILASKSAKEPAVDIARTKNPVVTLELAENLPANSVLFIMSAHHRTHQMETAHFWQALWNLRDSFKGNYRTVVLLSPDITLPIDVASDVFCIEEPMPGESELLDIVKDMAALVPEFKYSDRNLKDAARALRGLPPYAAEQAVALALRPQKVDIDEIQERKRELLNEIPGLKVYTGAETFKDIGGCDAVKELCRRVINGNESPEVIVFIDEGEKAMAGATHGIGDNTGVSQDFMGTLLTFMEDNESDGAIFVGPTGTAKSAFAKAMGNEAGVPTVFLDLGAMKNSLLGASEHRLRHALKIIDAIGHGKVFFIMTSNNISAIPPEFKRRFATGTFFFDLPTDEEQDKIWDIHTKKYGIDKSEVAKFDHSEWTGAEIRNCCRMAFRQKISLADAAEFIVPVAESGKESIAQLRKAASGNFLSANYKGVYKYSSSESVSTQAKRAVNLG